MSWSSRTRAVTVFRNCIDVLQMMKEQHAVEINKFLGDVLPTWLQGFAEVLAIQNSDESLLPIQLEIVKVGSPVSCSLQFHHSDRRSDGGGLMLDHEYPVACFPKSHQELDFGDHPACL